MAFSVVIVGGGAAGMSAAASVRRESPDAVITLFERGDWISYAMCGLPYFIGGVTDDPNDLVTYTPESFWEKRRVRVQTRHEVIEIDPDAKEITVRASDGSLFRQAYDRLILATGAASKAKRYIRGVPGAFGLHTMDDALAIREYLEKNEPRRVLVVGSGYIGLEMADELNKLKLDVTLWKGRTRFLGLDSSEIDDWIEETLEKHGVMVEKGRRFQRVTQMSRDSSHANADPHAAPHPLAVYATDETNNQAVVETDLLLLAIGSEPVPPPTLTRGSFKKADNGALIVDRYLRTNVPDIWAVGDSVVAPHRLGPPTYLALATTANRMGRIAGYNAVHLDTPIEFAGITGTVLTTAFGVDIARTGLSDDAARRAGFDPVAVTINAPDRSVYFPDVQRLILRLSADQSTGKLLGAEMAGPAGIGKRIDALSVALFTGLAVADLKQLDLAYVPPRSTVWDPILIAGHELEKKLSM